MELKEYNSIENARIKLIIDILDKYPKYIDENNTPNIFIGNNSFPLDSTELKQELQSICFDNNINYNTALINKVVNILSSKIRKNANKLELDYRITKDENGNFLYQLSKNEMVVIKNDKYNIEPILKPIFKVDNTFMEQVKPSKKPSIEKILDLINVSEEDRFLLLVFIISLFVPDIQKASLVLASPTGTGKSTITDIIKRIVDPTPNIKVKAPKSLNELEQVLSKAYLPCFDNVDYISTEQSNVLCRAITGDTHTHYEKNKTIVSSYTRPIILNGIKCPVYKEDLINRLLIIEPPRIMSTISRKDIDAILEKELPNALAYIFDVLSKARTIKSETKIDIKDRMGDWYVWAYCIADAIKYNGGCEFESLFANNRSKQNKIIINNNYSALALFDYVKNGGLFIGEPKEMTSTELYNILSSVAQENGYIKHFRNDTTWLIKDLKALANILENEGIIVEFIRKIDANYVKLTRIPPKE